MGYHASDPTKRSRLRRRIAALVAAGVALSVLLVGGYFVNQIDSMLSASRLQLVSAAGSSSATASSTPTTATATSITVPSNVAVAVLDLTDGDTVTAGSGSFDTASIVKVDIVAALLWQNGGELTSAQKELATAMITESDNDAATTLFNEVGGYTGLTAANKAFGLTETSVGTGGSWGITQTTTTDQMRLLKLVFTENTTLSDSSRAYIAGLMNKVIDTQRFGVTAAADNAADSSLKVGFLQRSSTGLWDINSIGEITHNGHTYLVVALSDNNSSYADGVSAIESAVVSAVDAID
jgi:beta-lactamase class A